MQKSPLDTNTNDLLYVLDDQETDEKYDQADSEQNPRKSHTRRAIEDYMERKRMQEMLKDAFDD